MKSVKITYKDINNIQREILVDSELKELDLSSKGIVSLGRGAFSSLPRLEVLWLNGNNIAKLNPDTFIGLGNLQKLYLYYNKIRDLPKGLFSHLHSLKRLELSMNQISRLDKDIFRENANLEKISLDFNQLYQLPTELFHHTTRLTNLVLSSNNLISIPPQLFMNLHALRFLSLSFNSLSHLPESLFSKECLLEEVRLDNNPFKELDLTAFQVTSQLKKIDILYCTGLEQITLKPVVKTEDVLLVPDTKIDFSASPITHPPPVIVSRGLRALVDYFSPEKTMYSSLTEIRLAFGVAGPEVKVDKCVLCKKPLNSKDRNICLDCESFYDDNFALGA